MQDLNAHDTKSRILKTALKLFAQNGYEATTTREICRVTGININLIYYYFGGKKELYDAVLSDVIKKQADFIGTRVNLNCELERLAYSQKIDMLTKFSEAMVDFFYGEITKEQMSFFMHAQQDSKASVSSPAYKFLSGLIGSVLMEKPNSREVVFKALFLMSQLIMPGFMPLFSLNILGQSGFNEKDIEIIKNNIRSYIKMMYLNKEKQQ